MMTMTTSTAAHTSHWPITTTMTTLKPSPTSPPSTASNLGDCCSPEATLTTPYGLQESPTRILLPTTSHAAVDLPVDNDQQHFNPFYDIVNPAENDDFSTYLAKWCDCNDEDFDYSSELDTMAEVCECMQRWLMATTVVTPTTPSTAMNPSQQSLMPLPHWCDHDDEDGDHPSEIDELITECGCLQQDSLHFSCITNMECPVFRESTGEVFTEHKRDGIIFLANPNYDYFGE